MLTFDFNMGSRINLHLPLLLGIFQIQLATCPLFSSLVTDNKALVSSSAEVGAGPDSGPRNLGFLCTHGKWKKTRVEYCIYINTYSSIG